MASFFLLLRSLEYNLNAIFSSHLNDVKMVLVRVCRCDCVCKWKTHFTWWFPSQKTTPSSSGKDIINYTVIGMPSANELIWANKSEQISLRSIAILAPVSLSSMSISNRDACDAVNTFVRRLSIYGLVVVRCNYSMLFIDKWTESKCSYFRAFWLQMSFV